LAPAPERFGPLKTKNIVLFVQLACSTTMFVEWELKFQAPAPTPPFKGFWLQLKPSKIAWALTPQPW